MKTTKKAINSRIKMSKIETGIKYYEYSEDEKISVNIFSDARVERAEVGNGYCLDFCKTKKDFVNAIYNYINKL